MDATDPTQPTCCVANELANQPANCIRTRAPPMANTVLEAKCAAKLGLLVFGSWTKGPEIHKDVQHLSVKLVVPENWHSWSRALCGRGSNSQESGFLNNLYFQMVS